MNIWLINPYGSIPGENWREYRFSLFANELSSKGHNVIWWTSAFSHHFKNHRSKIVKDLQINDKYQIRLIPSTGYQKNMSVKRFIRDLLFSIKVFKLGKKQEIKPDLIIYYESPLLLGYTGQKLAKKLNVPVIFDQMDLHPELMVKVFKRSLQPFVYFLLLPIYWNRKKIYGKLDGFIALSRYYLEVPNSESKKLADKPQEIIYNGINVNYFRSILTSKQFTNNLFKKEEDIWVIFAGTLGPSYDILNIIQVSKRFHNSNVKFLIAGDGPLKVRVMENLDTINYLGNLKPEELIRYYGKSDIGLSSYSKNSNVEMPDKFYDYTAAGLPIINSLNGEISNWIIEKNIGINYIAGDKNDLYNKINYLVTEKEKRETMRKNSYLLGDYFTQDQQLKKLHPLIYDVTKNFNKNNCK